MERRGSLSPLLSRRAERGGKDVNRMELGAPNFPGAARFARLPFPLLPRRASGAVPGVGRAQLSGRLAPFPPYFPLHLTQLALLS